MILLTLQKTKIPLSINKHSNFIDLKATFVDICTRIKEEMKDR